MDQGIISIIILAMVAENVTHIFQRGSIFKTVREFFEFRCKLLHDLLNCQLCLSFWVSAGVVVTVLLCPSTKIMFLVFAVHAVPRYIGAAHYWLMKI